MSAFQHESLAEGRWAQMSFSSQMANIGSEISRAIKAKKRGKHDRMTNAVERALELMDLSILCAAKAASYDNTAAKSHLRELTRARAEICDFFLDNNKYGCTDTVIMKYYDAFARCP